MVRRDGASTRVERLQEISKMIAKTMPHGVATETVLDAIEYGMGLTRKTAEKYLDLVIRKQEWITDSFGIIKPGDEIG